MKVGNTRTLGFAWEGRYSSSLMIIVDSKNMCNMIITNLWTRLLLLQPTEEDYDDFFYLCNSRGCGTRDGILYMAINKRGKKIRKRKLLADGFALFLSSAVFSCLPTLPAVALLFPVSAGVVSPAVRPAVSQPSSTCTTETLMTSWLVKSSRQPCNGHDLIIHSIPICILSNPKFGAIQEASNRLLGADGRDKIGNSRCIDRSDPFRFATLHFYDLISKRGSPRVGLRRGSRVLEDGRPGAPASRRDSSHCSNHLHSRP